MVLVRYYSPYSSRTRVSLWPRILAVFLAVVVLGTGGVAAWAFKSQSDTDARNNTAATAHAGTVVALGNGNGSVAGGTVATAVGPRATGIQPTSVASAIASTPNSAVSGTVKAIAATSVIPVANGSVSVAPAKLMDPRGAADTYVQAWNASDFKTMYALLTARAQGAIAADAFETRYRNIYAESGLTTVQVELTGQEPGTSQFRVKTTFTSSLVGQFTQENIIPLTPEGGQWRVEWTPSLIYNQLNGDGQVHFFADDPIRGRILDRKGRPLAQEGQVKQVGVVISGIKDENDMLTKLSAILKLDRDTIKKAYQGLDPSYFDLIKTLPGNTPMDTIAQLNAIPGVEVHSAAARTYPYGPLLAHVVGYIGEISADQLKMLAPKGYRSGDLIGQTGVEFWGEDVLAGKRGGRLAVRDPITNMIRSTIASKDKTDSLDIALSIDVDIQKAADDSLGDKTGSIVMMEPGTGNVLAMVSHPTFDPNIFVFGASKADLAALSNEQTRPQLNRATQATYPSGSIFKVVTMAAGFEKGGYTANQQLPCGGAFDLKGNVYHDWSPVRRTVTYQEGLVQSCDVVFYTVGQKLDDMDANILPTVARQFGLGGLTGIQGVQENPGVVPDPQWKKQVRNDGWSTGDAINLSIGQGDLLVTPLQMAVIYNAIASNGSLWQPRLVTRTLNADGSVAKDYPPVEKSKLPIKPENLAVMQAALQQVTTTPTGTATLVFKGMNPPPAGKTGTAEQQGDPHSWFASYYPAQSPTIAGVVMIEAGGEGSANAAPVTRAIYEKYAALPK